MEAIADTNILVYETAEDSIYHKEVVERLEEIDTLHLPTNILIEFILVLKKLGLADNFIIGKALELLEDRRIKLAKITAADFRESLKIIGQEKIDVKRLNDKIILALAKRNKVPIYTYDEQLKKQAKKMKLKVI